MSLYGIRQLTDSFRTVRRNTIQVAEEIPEADYQYRPAPASRSVAETLVLRTEGDRWVQWVEQLPVTFLLESVRLPRWHVGEPLRDATRRQGA